MKFNAVATGLVSAASLVGSAFADKYEYERLDKNNAVSCFGLKASRSKLTGHTRSSSSSTCRRVSST